MESYRGQQHKLERNKSALHLGSYRGVTDETLTSKLRQGRFAKPAESACAYLALGQTTAARQQAAELWLEAAAHDPQGFAIPAEVYLACADGFARIGNEGMSKEALGRGQRELTEQADQIANPHWRESYLSLLEHRELLRRFSN